MSVARKVRGPAKSSESIGETKTAWPRPKKTKKARTANLRALIWLRGQDLNLRPSGYEPDELPGCSTPRHRTFAEGKMSLLRLLYRQMKGPLARPEIPFGGPVVKRRFQHALSRPGSDLLSRVLRRSTISAGAFHGRVRNGNGCSHPAITTRSAKSMLFSRSCVLSCQSDRHLQGAMGTRNENDQADRAISTGKLHALPHFHTRPINVVVFHGSQGILVLRWVSRLDAFSGYPVRI